ncbi:MAG: tyrosine-type recombinase/integrase [Pseudomonadota bacterium]
MSGETLSATAVSRRRPRKPVPFLVRISGRFYWQPTRAVRSLGFAAEPLGKERLAAMRRALELNAQVAEERQRRDAPALKDPYWAAIPAGTPLNPLTGKPKGSVDDVVELYYRDHKKFASKAESTKRGYRYNIGRILAWCGGTMIAHIDRPLIKTWQLVLEQEAPMMAAAILRTLSILMGVARDWGYIADNPASKLGLASTSSADDQAEDGAVDILWTEEEARTFCATAVASGAKSLADALMLGLHLGQREGDVLRLRWSQYDEETGLFLIRPRKVKRRGVVLMVPASPELRAWLAAMPRPDDRNQVIVLREAGDGRYRPGPYKEDYFRARVAEIRDKANLRKALAFRYTRHTAATNLGRAGCSPHEIMAITGHTRLETVMKYVKPDPVMAAAAMAKLEAARMALRAKLGEGGEASALPED